MPPKPRNQRKLPLDGTSELNRGLSVTGSGSPKPATVKGKGRAVHSRSAIPDVFHDLLAETLISHESPDVPRKKRKVREVDDAPSYVQSDENHGDDDDDEMALDFEDVLPSRTEQTAYNDSGSDDSDLQWEKSGGKSVLTEKAIDGDLVLTLGAQDNPQRKSVAARRKAVTKAERALRLEIHKMNLLCLLRFLDRRNDWCNDKQVQESLKPLLTKKMLDYLRPKENNTQFGKAESVKKGLVQICDMWEANYNITARGMRRPFWAADEKELADFKLSADFDPALEKEDFRTAAKKLEGSRDVGAQLFCALLRSAGLQTRLACSLQLLPFTATKAAPERLVASPPIAREPTPVSEEEPVDMYGRDSPFGGDDPGMPLIPRRKLGHPNAANYFMPQVSSPQPSRPKSKPNRRRILESPFPVFWVEILDEFHQKWMPLNPLDSASLSKTKFFEPPASDIENSLSYVIAFEDEGTARDVTRRYSQAYNAKTRRNRVDSTPDGERWWKRTLRFYSRGWKSDLDQIEDMELATKEAREPMPKSVADFKDHPTYALERHLRRNEAFVSPREIGKVASGRDASGKKLESVYRRADVKLVKSADGWYRVGREVKVAEQPVKVVASKDEDVSETSLYTEGQTEVYVAPPVINGRVPKNTYGNLDVYVPSMVPKGGVHIPDPTASHAARLLGVDYADAVTGFEFRGRHGTAVVKGIVVASEYGEALEAVVAGYEDEQARNEEEMKSLNALRTWKRFLVALRIKERVDGYQTEGEDKDAVEEAVTDNDDSGMDSEEYFDDGGGGFFPE